MSATAHAAGNRERRTGARLAVLGWTRDYGILVALVLLCIFFAFTSDSFLRAANLRNLIEESSEPGLIACGMTVAIIAGEFDFSVGAIFGFAGVIGVIAANQFGLAAALIAAVAVGAALGAINGVIVVHGRIQSFIVTLATQFVFVGVAIYITHGLDSWQAHNPEAFARLADSTLLSVQLTAWFALAVFTLIWFVLRWTQFGRQVYAVGGNPVAARVVGARINLVRIAVFVISGALAAFAGLLAASDTGVAQADGGIGLEFTAITAVIIGGTSIAGGRGGVWRTLSGVLLLAVIANGLTLLYVNPTYDLLVEGTIILIAVLLDAVLKRGDGR